MKYEIDATGQVLGRLASNIASVLQGKTSPSYNPRLEGQDVVLVKNASKIKITGRKYTDKIYYKHTHYIGHLKELSFKQIFERDPRRVVELAVKNMLPKNRLRALRLKRLTIEK
jgi:large subunit ribosomal protein L13